MMMLRTLLQFALGKRLPTIDGSLRLSGVHAPITIRRDEHGIPYIEASSDEDAFFAMGFTQAQDRAFQMELYVRVARGTLAEVLGEEMLPVDRLMRRIGFAGIARAQVAVLDASVRSQLDAFARGVNAGMEHGASKKPHELTMLGLKKASTFTPVDVISVLQFFAFALSSNWDAELSRLRILQSDGAHALEALEASDPEWTRAIGGHVERFAIDAGALAVAEQLANDASAVAKIASVGGASNAWAVAPSRTTTGRAILACDPHLSPALPAHWYLIHVRTPSWAMRGACLPTQPVVTFGHNEHLAWGITAGHVDNTDLFVERVSPDGTSVREGDEWRRCEVREEIIAVKGKPPVTERVLITPRGPIVSPCIGTPGSSGSDVALSLRGTWMAARRIAGYDIRNAKNVDDACAVYASYPATSENRVFADTTGRIAWHVVGDAPVRKKGAGMLPAPGWDPAYGWEDEPLPYDALPSSIDPVAGFVVTANAYPGPSPTGAFLGADWLDGSRHARITELLERRRDWDIASTMLVQIDRKTMVWPRIRGVVLDAARSSHIASRLLDRWDGVVGPESPAATIFELFFSEMMMRVAKAKAPNAWRAAIGEGTNVLLPHGMMTLRRIDHLARLIVDQPAGFFAHGWRAEMVAAITEAMRIVVSTAGDDEARWGWGHVRPLFLVHPVGTKKPLDRIWNRGPLAFGGDVTTIPQASIAFDTPLGNAIGVPNLRAVFDVGNWEDSRFILAGGQSGNPLSPHYDDMLERWLRGEGVTMAWSPESVIERATSTLEITPG